MKNEKKLVMPSNFENLTTDEMINNTSGWYINVQEKKFMITKSDFEAVDSYLNKFFENKNMSFRTNIAGFFKDPNSGVNIQGDDSGLLASFSFNETELEEASSNTFKLFTNKK